MILTSGLSYRPCWIIQNPLKMPFWMIQIAKNKVFGHFLEFGASDRLQIAYFDNTKWFWQFGCHMAHAGVFKYHKNPCLNDPKRQKWGVWPFSGVRSVGSTWYCILWKYYMLYNICQRCQIKNDHLKITKMHFWMIWRVKNRFLAILRTLDTWIGFILHIVIITIVC